jgi:hypothetical protein
MKASLPQVALMARVLALALFLVSAPLYLLAHSAVEIVLRPAPYHQLIEELRVAERLRPRVAEVGLTKTLPLTTPAFVAHPARPPFDALPRPARPPRALPDFPASTWETIADEVIAVDWLNAQAHVVVDGLFEWLEGEAPLPEFAVDLSAPLDRLQGSGGTLALLPFLEGTPACARRESVNGYGVYASCLPPGANVESAAQQTTQRLAEVLPRSPKLASLLALGLVEPEVVTQLTRLRFAARWAELLTRLLGNISLLAFAVYSLLTIRDWRGLITRSAWPLLSVGGVGLALAVGLGLLAQRGQLAAWLAPGAEGLMREAVVYLGRAVAVRLAWWSGITLGLAAGLWALNYWLLRRKRKGVSPTRRAPRIRRQFV